MALTEFNFTLIMKLNLEKRIFYLCLNVAGFLKNFRQIRAHLRKKIKRRAFDMARPRKWADSVSDEEMGWLKLHPSIIMYTVAISCVYRFN